MWCERDHAANHKILSCRQVAAKQLKHHVVHGLGMKDLVRERQQQHDERKKRQNRVGSDTERKSMHLSLHEISRKRR